MLVKTKSPIFPRSPTTSLIFKTKGLIFNKSHFQNESYIQTSWIFFHDHKKKKKKKWIVEKPWKEVWLEERNDFVSARRRDMYATVFSSWLTVKIFLTAGPIAMISFTSETLSLYTTWSGLEILQKQRIEFEAKKKKATKPTSCFRRHEKDE